MADPLSVSASVVGLVANFTQAAIGCNNLIKSYKGAPIAITSIHTECTVLRIALNQVYAVMTKDLGATSDRMTSDSRLAEDFEIALDGCQLTFQCLDEELRRILKASDQEEHQQVKWKDRFNYVWNEESMKSILEQMRGLSGAVNLLLTALVADTVATVYQLQSARMPVIEKVKSRTASVRSGRASIRRMGSVAETSSLTGRTYDSSVGDAEFAFDQELINTQAYRNVLHSARSRARSAPPLPVEPSIMNEEELLIDFSDPDPPVKHLDTPYHEDLLGLGVTNARPVSVADSTMTLQSQNSQTTTLVPRDDGNKTGVFAATHDCPSIEVTPPPQWSELVNSIYDDLPRISWASTSEDEKIDNSPSIRAQTVEDDTPESSAAATLIRHKHLVRQTEKQKIEAFAMLGMPQLKKEVNGSSGGSAITREERSGIPPAITRSKSLDLAPEPFESPSDVPAEFLSLWWNPQLMSDDYRSYRFIQPVGQHSAFARMDSRILLVGDSLVGKTALIKAFLGVSEAKRWDPTMFESCSIQGQLRSFLRPANREGFVIVQELGGQDIYTLASTSYPAVAPKTTVVLCFRIGDRTSLDNIIQQRWPEAAQSYPHSTFFLVGLGTEHRSSFKTRLPDRPPLGYSLIDRDEGIQAAMECGATAYFEAPLKGVASLRALMSTVVGYAVARQLDDTARTPETPKKRSLMSLRLLKGRERPSPP